MPPQGLLLIAAVLPEALGCPLHRRKHGRGGAADFAWADAVFVSGMHIQRRQIQDICTRAHAAGKAGRARRPSVSACPELYPDFDYLHVGELGDATDALIDAASAGRRAARRGRSC